MRLSENEKQAIIKAVSDLIGNTQASLYLYGSRVDDKLKGGDIDLILVMHDDNMAQRFALKNHQFSASIKKLIGNRKIDFSVKSKSAASSDAFWLFVLQNAVLLHAWS